MRSLAREADDDSESLAGQEPCRWQSRLSEGLGVCVLLERQKQACSVLQSDNLPRQAREGAFECPQGIETDIGASLLCLRIGGHRTQTAKLSGRGDTGRSPRCLRLGAEGSLVLLWLQDEYHPKRTDRDSALVDSGV